MVWETKRLKDLVTVNELTLSDSTNPNYEFDYVDIGSVSQFKIAETEIMSFFEAPSRARRIVRKNDILVSTVRTYLKAITYIDFEPKDLERIFSIPASSNTERTAPPAIIPVPSEAGLNITAPAPDFPVIG